MNSVQKYLIVCLMLLSTCVSAESKFTIDAKHQQLILVLTDNWQANTGEQYRFERSFGKAHWQLVADKTPVTIGRTGLAWGIGLHPKQSGYHKQEGDGKAPAGIFTLGSAFGYLNQVNTGLAYQAMSRYDYCIDVKGSNYYNQIVSSQVVGDSAIQGSSEPMRRDLHLNGDQVYKKGFVINHNPNNISGSGSCIFAHLWRASDKSTAGCTAMPEKEIDKTLNWLDKEKQPLYIALPKAEYLQKQALWQLPELALTD